ncbi:uncharacterized protein VP01_3234g2, partial [Puccinia sorghi]
SDLEIFNSASWTPALSANISPNDHHASTHLYGSTEIKYPIISPTLPHRCNFHIKPSPSNDGLQQLLTSHNQEDYDVLASSLIDGNSDVDVTDPENDTSQIVHKEDSKLVPSNSLFPSSRHQTGEDKQQDEKPLLQQSKQL